MKQLFKKAYWDGKDPWLALLDLRDTPTEGVDASPAQTLMSRRTSSLVPTLSLYSALKSFRFCIEAQVEKEKKPLVVPWSSGKAVTRTSNWTRSQNGYHRLRRDHSWKHGTYIEKLSDRSYVTQSGDSTLRRNRQFLKPTEPQDKEHADVNAHAMECNHNEIPREPVISEQTPSSASCREQDSHCGKVLSGK